MEQYTRRGLASASWSYPRPKSAIFPGSRVLDEHVGPQRQLAPELAVFLCAKVENEAALVAVDCAVVGSSPAVPRRAPQPRRVSDRGLDLDHCGSEVAEEHREVWAGKNAREVGDEQAIERAQGAVSGRRHLLIVRPNATGNVKKTSS